MNSKPLSCPACGAVNNNNAANNCAFCGTILPKIDEQRNSQQHKIVKAELSGLYKDCLSYVSRGISDINDIINIHPDNEISEVRRLYLQKNRIVSINGINKFELTSLNLSYNELEILDDFPTIERDLGYNTIDERLTLHLAFNTKLTSFNDHVIQLINSYRHIKYCVINLVGCSKFDPACLAKIDYKTVLGGKGVFYIHVDSNINIPSELTSQGFEVTKNLEFKMGISGDKSQTLIGDQWFLIFKSPEIETKNNTSQEIEAKNNPSKKNETEQKNSGCFIATAVMGDYDHPVVIDLRMFRDNWLLKRKWGINFTNWYYKHGPKAVSVIEQSTVLRRLTFILLVKPLQLISKKLK